MACQDIVGCPDSNVLTRVPNACDFQCATSSGGDRKVFGEISCLIPYDKQTPSHTIWSVREYPSLTNSRRALNDAMCPPSIGHYIASWGASVTGGRARSQPPTAPPIKRPAPASRVCPRRHAHHQPRGVSSDGGRNSPWDVRLLHSTYWNCRVSVSTDAKPTTKGRCGVQYVRPRQVSRSYCSSISMRRARLRTRRGILFASFVPKQRGTLQ